jgi:hypothetical protein
MSVYVGQPATIHLYTDSLAAVVTKVNAKSIVVCRVENDESTKFVTNPNEPLPCIGYQGNTNKIIGKPERYSIIETSYGTKYRNGSISVTLGKSVSITDYRH